MKNEANKNKNIAGIVYAVMLAILVAVVAWAFVYASKQDDGKVTYNDSGYSYTKADGEIVHIATTTTWTTVPTTTATASGEVYKWREDVPLSQELQGHIWAECKAADIPTNIVYAVIECESNFDENAVSDGGDYGLMQLNEICHAELCEALNLDNVIEPFHNVKAGIYLLSKYYHEYDNWNAALMAYNCGKGGAEELFADGIYTTDYADKVLKMARKY